MMETITLKKGIEVFLVIIGAGIVYYLLRKEKDPKDIFLIHKSKFNSLIEKLAKNSFSINDWTEKIVDINDKTLINWWNKLVKRNKNAPNQVKDALIRKLEEWGIQPINEVLPPPIPEKKINRVLARKAFLNNVDKFVPILDSLLNKSFDLKEWTECIIDINDSDLTALWEKYVSSFDPSQLREKWLKTLQSWNLRPDTCKTFTCATQDNTTAYQLLDGGDLTMGVKYKVESPCWILTQEEENGNVTKKVVNKGLVTPVIQ